MVLVYVGLTLVVCILTVITVKRYGGDGNVSVKIRSSQLDNKVTELLNRKDATSALQSGRSIKEHVSCQIALDKHIAIDKIKNANDLKIDFGYTNEEIDILICQLENDFQIKAGKLAKMNIVYVEDLVKGLQKYTQSPCECYFKEGDYNRCQHDAWLHLPNVCVAVMGFHKSGDSTLLKALMKYAFPGSASCCKDSDDTLCQFASEHSHYTLIDVPGSARKLNKTVKGMALCDAGIFIVSVSDDEIDRESMDKDDSLRLLIARSMGVKRLVVFINKVDLKSDYVYLKKVENHIRAKLERFGFDSVSTPVIFGSAKKALYDSDHQYGKESIIKLIKKMDWYFNPISKELKTYRIDPFRLTISYVDSLTGEAEGVIASGVLEVGDTVAMCSSSVANQLAKVTAISIFESEVKAAYSGDYVKLKLECDSSLISDNVVSICDTENIDDYINALNLKFYSVSKRLSSLKMNRSHDLGFTIFILGVEMIGAATVESDTVLDQSQGIVFNLSKPFLRVQDNSAFVAVLDNEIIGHGIVTSHGKLTSDPKLKGV